MLKKLIFIFFSLWGPLCAQQTDKVEILTDKVYLYSYFNVLFKTPFSLDENVIIKSLDEAQILRTEKLSFSKYRDGSLEHRAFILGFYAVNPGLHKLPSIQFQSTLQGASGAKTWQSPTLPFAVFQIDEGELALPVSAQLNPIPQRVYLGQNIVLNVWASNVTSIDQNSLRQNPEFRGFLVQKSPLTPEVERYKVLEQNAYRVSLATWLLNPIELGQLNIPAIQTSIMGLERQTTSRQIEILPLPPNASNLASENIAIGQFDINLELEPSKRLNGPQYPKDELIHAVLRITGSGNIHLVKFPKITLPSNLVLLQSEERESLDLDFDNAELSGWREKEYIYKAKAPGEYELNLQNFSYFDSRLHRWVQKSAQTISLHVSDLETQNYYTNLEELSFSPLHILWWDILYWLQKHAFYICLLFFILTTFYFLQQVPSKKPPPKPPIKAIFSVPNIVAPKPNAGQNELQNKILPKKLQVQRAFWNITQAFSSRNGFFCIAIFIVLLLFYLFAQNRGGPQINKEHPTGQLASIALQQYKDGQSLKALETAYLYYSKLPLLKASRRLAGSIRLKFGLEPTLPIFFFWSLQIQHLWRYISMLLFALLSAYFIYKNGKRKQQTLLRSYRNYFLCTILLLLSLSIPLRLHLAMNTAAKLQLKAIPQHSRTENLLEQRSNWNNSLARGELVKIKGHAGQVSYLVVGEKQDQGWIDAQNLFIFP